MNKDLSKGLIWRAVSGRRCRECTAPHLSSGTAAPPLPAANDPSVAAGNSRPPWAHRHIPELLLSFPQWVQPFPSSCSWSQCALGGGDRAPKGSPFPGHPPFQVTAVRPGLPCVIKLCLGLKDAKGSCVGEGLANYWGEGKKDKSVRL